MTSVTPRSAATSRAAAAKPTETSPDFSRFVIERVSGDYESDEVHGRLDGQQVVIKFNTESPDKVFGVSRQRPNRPLLLGTEQMAQLVPKLAAYGTGRARLIADRINVASRLTRIKSEVDEATHKKGTWTADRAEVILKVARDENGNVGLYESHLIEAALYAASMSGQLTQQAANVFTLAKQAGTFPTEIQVAYYEMGRSILAGTPSTPEPFNPVWETPQNDGEFEP